MLGFIKTYWLVRTELKQFVSSPTRHPEYFFMDTFGETALRVPSRLRTWFEVWLHSKICFNRRRLFLYFSTGIQEFQQNWSWCINVEQYRILVCVLNQTTHELNILFNLREKIGFKFDKTGNVFASPMSNSWSSNFEYFARWRQRSIKMLFYILFTVSCQMRERTQ